MYSSIFNWRPMGALLKTSPYFAYPLCLHVRYGLPPIPTCALWREPTGTCTYDFVLRRSISRLPIRASNRIARSRGVGAFRSVSYAVPKRIPMLDCGVTNTDRVRWMVCIVHESSSANPTNVFAQSRVQNFGSWDTRRLLSS